MAESNDEKITNLWKDYENVRNYRRKINLEDAIIQNNNFYEGRQWKEAKESNKALPRPTFNFIEMIVDNKVANMLSSPTATQFFCTANPESATQITEFHNFMEKELKIEKRDKEVVKRGAVEGTSFLHFFYNADKIGKRGMYEGGVDTEIIEALNIGFANPRECDVQSQEWIIIESRESVDAVKDMADKDIDLTEIESDDLNSYDTADKEQEDSNMVTVLTRYFKIDGEVYFEKATKNVIFQKARALNPRLNKVIEDDEEVDAVDTDLPDVPKEKKTLSTRKASLYPIAMYTYKDRKNCIYGRSEVEPLVPNNKAVNFNSAMMCLSIENQGWGTIVAKEGALDKKAKLSNDPSKLLIDKYKGGNGYYTLNKQPFSHQAFQLNSDILETTRSITGSTEVMTGEVMGSNQSGTSIAYLQQQAQKPVNELVKTYRRYKEACAEILLQFYIHFYTDKEFIIEPKQEGDKPTDAIFNGSNYEGLDFTITIEVGAGTQYSEIANINLLDNLFNAGHIDLKTYLSSYPDNILGDKNKLMKAIEVQEQSQVAQLTAQNQQLTAQLEKSVEVLKQQSEIIESAKTIIDENRGLKATLIKLQGEYTSKLNLANNEISQTFNDAQTLATQLYNNQKGAVQTTPTNPTMVEEQ